jgi:CubicO group peptidase (beta-lactamase class C family)
MRRLFNTKAFAQSILLLLLISLLLTAQRDLYPEETNTNKDTAVELDKYLTLLAKRGASFAILVASRGEVVLAKGYGLADRKQDIGVTPDTVFDIGSITKQFTAAAILKLEEEGLLSVNDAITKYFDAVPADKRSITLHNLLTHTSGIRDSLGGDYDPLTREEFIKEAWASRLKARPGERYRYSNAGYSLLAAVIEKVSGRSYDTYLHEHLFKPAGMTQTGYRIPKWKDGILAHGYILWKDWGTPLEHPWDTDGPYWNLRGNGGMLSTVSDMYKWHLALERTGILSETSKNKLFTPHVPEDESGESYYCYGWTWEKTPRNTSLISHNGSNLIFYADFKRFTDEDVAIIFMSNCGPIFAGKYILMYQSSIEQIIFGRIP